MRALVSIQILRGIAAMLVVLLHSADVSFAEFLVDAPAFRLGGAGVDIFFVISGYVMWSSTASSPTGAAAFWKARFIRIAPLYYFATLLFVGLMWATAQLPVEFSVHEIVLSLLFIPFVNSIDRQDVPILGAGWTLNYEVLFYLVFGIALRWRKPGHRFLFVLLVFGLLAACRPLAARENALMFRFTSPVLLEFVLGMGTAWLIGSGRVAGVRAGAALAALGLVSLVVLEIVAPWLPRTIAWGPPAALLVYGLVCCEPLLARVKLSVLLRLGDASYSIYLANGIVCHFLMMGFGKPPALPAALIFPVTVLVSTVCGLLLYRWVERPMLRSLQRRFLSTPHAALPGRVPAAP